MNLGLTPAKIGWYNGSMDLPLKTLDPDALLTPQEVAAVLRYSKNHVLDLIREGKIEYIAVKPYRIPVQAVLDFLERNRKKVKPIPAQKTRRKASDFRFHCLKP